MEVLSKQEMMIAEDDLSNWELVNASDLDEDEQHDHLIDYSDSAYDSDGAASWLSLMSLLSSAHDDDDDDDDDDVDAVNEGEEEPLDEEDVLEDDYGDYEDDDDDENDDLSDDGLDDELVPRYVSDRLGRERMRKLGKRACAKMAKSKRSPYLYTRPGCVHGKHGLGLKHSF
ncbi:uncharacterized protein LOC131156459 [Malania oleifera]|uniref:uncharacterized protein LOC131156459 n=1 Tax=Malania oleifera TaxID=397392 RepID=UPI0025AE99F7|nr:uncharacterized protein LOC131156459 [Malania oleifera]